MKFLCVKKEWIHSTEKNKTTVQYVDQEYSESQNFDMLKPTIIREKGLNETIEKKKNTFCLNWLA